MEPAAAPADLEGGAALACRNTVVVKPSEETPGTATLLAEVLADAGLPSGAYNVVHGFGAGSAGGHLTGHPGVDGVTFTGSSEAGIEVMRSAAARVRPVSFELGGKNAAIVFDDADLAATLDGLTRSVFANTGQREASGTDNSRRTARRSAQMIRLDAWPHSNPHRGWTHILLRQVKSPPRSCSLTCARLPHLRRAMTSLHTITQRNWETKEDLHSI